MHVRVNYQVCCVREATLDCTLTNYGQTYHQKKVGVYMYI